MKLDDRCLDAEFCVGCDRVLVSARFLGILGVGVMGVGYVAGMAVLDVVDGAVVVMAGEL